MAKTAEAALATAVWIAAYFGGMALALRANGMWMAIAIGGVTGLMFTIAGSLLRRYDVSGMMRDD